MIFHDNGKILDYCSTSAGQRESNEAEFIAIKEALKVHRGSFQKKLIIEGETLNTIHWAKSRN